MTEIAVTSELPRFKPLIPPLRRSLNAALKKVKSSRASFEVFLISDGAMGDINWRTRRKRGPATVLSFPSKSRFPRPDLGSRVRYLGEIYLAPDFARRRGMPLRILAFHGLLHLLGYTHKGKRDTITMERLEEKLIGR